MTALVDAEGPAQWQASFNERLQSDHTTTIWMTLTFKLKAQIACGLCAEPLALTLDETRVFSFAENEDEATDLDEQASEHDVLVADPKFDLGALIEDELILSLPVLPRHQDCSDLAAEQDMASPADFPVDSGSQQQTQRPFADLASQMAAAGRKPEGRKEQDKTNRGGNVRGDGPDEKSG